MPSLLEIRSTFEEAKKEGIRRRNQIIASRTGLLPHPHNRDNSNADSYYETFKKLEQEFLPHIMKNIKNELPGEKIAVIDIMGTGSVFKFLPEEVRPDYIFAICLFDERTEDQKINDEKNHIYVIEGNVVFPSTWKKLHKKMRETGIYNFQYAYARPLNGMETIPPVPWLIKYIGQQVYNLLDKKGGTFLSEGPRELIDLFLNWPNIAKKFNINSEASTIEKYEDKFNYFPRRPIIKIIRNEDSFDNLPDVV